MKKSRLDRKKMGQNIRCLRLLHGWSQSELAARAGISVNQLSRLERGTSGMSCRTFFALCHVLSCVAAELLYGAE